MKYDLAGKHIIITGANSGIGKAAAVQLAQHGGTIIMACRSVERGNRAVEEVRRVTNNEKVSLLQVDMASHESIRRFSNAYLERFERLDVLIHNAANFDQNLKEPILTEDGIETIFATNHVGVFLLTHLLLDLLKSSAPSRIITVASKGLLLYPFLDIEFNNLNGQKRFNWQHAYYHSKLAQVMFTYDLGERLKGSGVTVNCVRVTNVAIPDDRIQHLPKWLLKIYQLKRRMSITPERQAETYVYLAADPEVQDISGKYWDEHNRQVHSSRKSNNRVTWEKLWRESVRLAGIQVVK